MGDPASSGTKRCGRCGEVKPHHAFSHRRASSDGLQSCCKACHSAMDRANYLANANRRERILHVNERRRRAQTARLAAVKAEAGCADCGERDPVVLDFDHLDPRTKVSAVALMTGGPWSTIAAEIAKCEVVCANCHRRRTHRRRQRPVRPPRPA